MAICPICKSSHVLVRRETTNTYRSGSSHKWSTGKIRTRSSHTTIYRQTVGVCKSCGYTWVIQSDPTFGGCLVNCIVWCFKLMFYPIPLTIWLWKRKMNIFIKIILTAIVIISYLVLLSLGQST